MVVVSKTPVNSHGHLLKDPCDLMPLAILGDLNPVLTPERWLKSRQSSCRTGPLGCSRRRLNTELWSRLSGERRARCRRLWTATWPT